MQAVVGRGGVEELKPILPGARGPAVEDIQRRLLVLGYDLGRTGVDGVFLGMTRDAVIAFQTQHNLSEDGVVGEETWSALVDETFTLGDRMLYLRLPHFHGRDVRELQQALSTLGFSCNTVDGIFGRFTEQAVREFQRNCGQPGDGIAGPDTVRALMGLRHVWEGKAAPVPAGPDRDLQRTLEPLTRTAVEVGVFDGLVVESTERRTATEITARLVNLVQASDDRALLWTTDATSVHPQPEIVIELGAGEDFVAPGTPVVSLGDDGPDALAGRILTALAVTDSPCKRLVVDVGSPTMDEQTLQRSAVRLLDALCAALA